MQKTNFKTIVFTTLLVMLAQLSHAQAFCPWNGANYDNSRCPGDTMTLHNPYVFGNSSNDFILPPEYTMLSRTARSITLKIGRVSSAYRTVNIITYDSLNNCSGSMGWTDHFQYNASYPDIVGMVPTCPVPGQSYLYTTRHWANNNPWGPETVAWSVVGGTIVSTTSSSGNVPPYIYDSVSVQWTPNVPHKLSATRTGSYVTVWSPITCSYDVTIQDSFPTAIIGPNSLCNGQSTASYQLDQSLPGFTYAWTCSNGTIVSGQGSSSVVVNWAGSGTLSVLTTATACGATSNAQLSVAIFATAAPAPNLGPDILACNQSQVILNPGSFASYHWSNLWNTPSMTPTSSGTYAVTVTNAAGCTAADTVQVTFSGGALPVSLGPITQPLCAGNTLSPGTFSTYLWNTGATTPSIVPTANGTYSVTVSNGNCTSSASTQITLVTRPAILGPDTALCTDATLRGPLSMAIYQWSTGQTTPTIPVTNSGPVSLTVTTPTGCVYADTMLLQVLPDCVFPGDANYDFIADNLDVLAIGAYYGRTNAPRANASSLWVGQPSPDWGNPLIGAADPKHSDCNGNGTVQPSDTMAVVNNYLQTHSKVDGVVTVGVRLRVVPLADSVLQGNLAWFRVLLDDNGLDADSIYGLALSALLAPSILDKIESVDYGACWFAGAGNRLTLTQPISTQETDIAMVRTDHVDALGQGEVCRIGVRTDSNQAQAFTILQLTLDRVHVVSHELVEIPVITVNGSVVVTQTPVHAPDPEILHQPSIFPNPARDEVQVSLPAGGLKQVVLYDLQGRELRRISAKSAIAATISVADLPQGFYLLEVQTRLGRVASKLMVQH